MSSRPGKALRSRFVAALYEVFACALLLAGCASKLVTEPAEITLRAPGTTTNTLRLDASVDVRLDSGYSRTLKRGTTWKWVGSISQGEVWEPIDTVLTVEGRYVHEAYLVISAPHLVGFYLPVEDAFLQLRTPIPLKFTTN